jgi:hypothetical protein
MRRLYLVTGRKGRGSRLGLLVAITLATLAPAERPGVPPATSWTCPGSHPIKGYLSEESGLLFHLPGGRFYEEASPARCYASEEEARRDGARRSPDDRSDRR